MTLVVILVTDLLLVENILECPWNIVQENLCILSELEVLCGLAVVAVVGLTGSYLYYVFNKL
jgi:hypothetical protein